MQTIENNILVIAGLGNPGLQYAQTRHNVGFRVLDNLIEKLGADIHKEKFDGIIYNAKIGKTKVLLVKPQTFMNASGTCLNQIKQFYKLMPENFVVIYDDIDLPEGKIRIRAKGGAGTHNGMRSIVSAFGSESFMRIRVGIGQPTCKEMDLADYVLGKFSKDSQGIMNKAFLRAADAAVEIGKSGINSAMQIYNTME